MTFDPLLKPIFIEALQKVAHWYQNDKRYYLRSIFDLVGFIDRNGDEPEYFVPPAGLSSRLHYPEAEHLENFEENKKQVLSVIRENYDNLSQDSLDKFNANQLFVLLEKFGGNVPLDETGEISIFDAYKIKAARAVIQHNRQKEENKDNLLINIDLSGIQKFIYNIVSAGALKNLRSRSFFIELLCYHIIYRVLRDFQLHQANILMNGGGSIYILASQPKDYQKILDDIDYDINKFLLDEFNGRLHAAFAYVECTDERIEQNIKEVINELSREIFKKKQRKFGILIEKGEFDFVDELDPTFEQCEVCHKDEKYGDKKHKLIPVAGSEDRYRCKFCDLLIKLGNDIADIGYIYKVDKPGEKILTVGDSNYLLKESDVKDRIPKWIVFDENNEDFFDQITSTTVPIYARTFTTKNQDLPERVKKLISEQREVLKQEKKKATDEDKEKLIDEEIDALKDKHIALMEYIAEAAEGAKYIAALRMDADNMGKILHEGFYGKESLERLSAFSRNVNNFFKLHLESLCKNGSTLSDEHNAGARNVQVIYAGGDDLFILGAWSDTMELAIDIGNTFKNYTGNNIDMGLSGGLTVHHANFPVSKMARLSMKGLDAAKNNFEACWMCRKEWIACPLYKKGKCLRKYSFAPFFTEYNAF